ncbi:MAG: DEAD/DEAH box helicase family protein [Nitrospira sp.]|nr:DEAD/DEAH box helicase family protein [Nitrospira sp.]
MTAPGSSQFSEPQLRALELRLKQLDVERAEVLQAIKELKSVADRETAPTQGMEKALLGRSLRDSSPITPDEQITVFLQLFRCRESVYPKRWENAKSGKSGYAPACRNEWVQPLCQKPTIRCTDCGNQAFLPLNEDAAHAHLQGQLTIGTYAIDADDSCVFLACDFDGAGWKEDVSAYRECAKRLGLDVAVERSCSGQGAHAWIFFDGKVPARLARNVGTLILSRCLEARHQLSMKSFDRLFPSQDYVPKGGFGNLIALPLQKTPRESGNSCFLDERLSVIQDQWEYLVHVKRPHCQEVQRLLDRFLPRFPKASTRHDAFDDVAWITDRSLMDAESGSSDHAEPMIEGAVELTVGSMIRVPLTGLPGRLLGRLRKTASFPNPTFYKLQRMRMQTYPHPRFIFSGELRPDELLLPRGLLDWVTHILSGEGALVVMRDERLAKRRIKVEFVGELTPSQKEAVKALKKSEVGVLVAPPGFGKTVVGCALIAERHVSTLVLVHRQPLLDQWKEGLMKFLGLNPKEIGILGGTIKKTTGKLDLMMLQTLTRMGDLHEIALRYSHVIIDECHHIPAVSFEGVLKQLPARYVLGLTATPYRKDGLEAILFQQCGPVRHEIVSADEGKLEKTVTISETGYRPPSEVGEKPAYHVLMHSLVNDTGRNSRIAADIVKALSAKQFPLVISDRKDHLDTLTKGIESLATAEASLAQLVVIRLDGDMSIKERRLALERIREIRTQGVPLLVVATAPLVGEGVDLPELDTLVLATPLSFEGRMVQYAGRLHRLVEGKTHVRIVDYVDSSNAMLLSMYRNRVKAYRKMGYEIREPHDMLGGSPSRVRGKSAAAEQQGLELG